ncbi:MAG: hypothetical protein JWR27_1402 [Aeromicrobium sp.]|nr:hypothetical protein [Aeromicrobium sp.]
MSNPPPLPERPSTRGYVVAGVLTALAVLVAISVSVVIARAVAGYDITPIPAGQDVSILVEDRGVALWVAPELSSGTCTSTLEGTETSTMSTGSADRITVTDGGLTWVRVGIVKGTPGSHHTVLCSGEGDVQAFGFAPNPRIGRYVVMGLAAGGIVGLLLLTAFIIALVTGLRRSRRRGPD